MAPVEPVPLVVTRALPGGIVSSDTFAELVRCIKARVEIAGRLDGILVAPHGAAVAQSFTDADGHWLAELRALVGAGVPIVGTLDAHANLSTRMVQSCNALIAYRTNPHLDQRERGREAARLLVETIRQRVEPTMSAVFPPLSINIQQQCTSEPHLRPLYDLAAQQRRNQNVLSNSILLGFPYADVAEMGSAALVVTHQDVELADRLAADLGQQMWNRRDAMCGQFTSIEEAISQCESLPVGSICLLDMGDNVGGGSSADGTDLIAALHQSRLGPSFGCLFDPESVGQCDAAGVGERIRIRAGGKTDQLHGEPLEVEVSIRSLHDGRFREDQPRHGGFAEFDQGRTAVVDTDGGLTVMLTSRRMVPFSLQQLISCNIDPSCFRILVAKGVNAPLAAYRDVCRHFIRVNSKGSTCADLTQLVYQNRRRPLFPFERDFDWQPPGE